MGINKSFATANVSVPWNGEEAASVRGLTVNDISNILIAEGQSTYALFDEFDSLKKAVRANGVINAENVADTLMASAPALLAKISQMAPSILARIIVVASDDDDPEAAMASVLKFPIPLQIDALAKIAEQTFLGPEGFRVFLGNVQALVAAFAGMTNAQRQAALDLEPSNSEIGAEASSS